MITEVNGTSTGASIRKYMGVASIKVVGVNPDNATLRKYGWNLPEDAEEPSYVSQFTGDDGKMRTTARVRVLAQIQELKDKPVVALDFSVSPEICVNRDGTKCQVIDRHGNTAWATREDMAAKRVPQYSNGPAVICTPYKQAHRGEGQLVAFLARFLNVTPFRIYSSGSRTWELTKNPGIVTIDDWDALCKGDAAEVRKDIALKPDNIIKVCLGVRTGDNNRAYQAFLRDGFWRNSIFPDINTGEYRYVRTDIDRFMQGDGSGSYQFDAKPVHEWVQPGPDEVAPSTGAAPGSLTGSAPGGTAPAGDLPGDGLPFGDDLPFFA